MANKDLINKDKIKNKKKRNARDFKDLEELKEKQVYKPGQEISTIYPVKENKE